MVNTHKLSAGDDNEATGRDKFWDVLKNIAVYTFFVGGAVAGAALSLGGVLDESTLWVVLFFGASIAITGLLIWSGANLAIHINERPRRLDHETIVHLLDEKSKPDTTIAD